MILIYHSKDLDGYCSGAIMKKKYPKGTLFGYDYGEPFPWDLVSGEDVIMADVSLPMNEMVQLNELASSFIWIDHHKSAIQDYEALENKFLAYLDSSLSACELTWMYLFGDPLPYSVLLLGRYDTWRQAEGDWELTLAFQYGMRSVCNSAETFPQELLRDGKITSYIDVGRAVLDYQKRQNEIICKSAFVMDFEGYKAICVNTTNFNSQTFESVYSPLEYDLMMPFAFDGTSWKYSIYTTKPIDCSILAKKYGGGGHAKAAGFKTDKML